jgi:integrase
LSPTLGSLVIAGDLTMEGHRWEFEERAAPSGEDPTLVFPNARGAIWRPQVLFAAFEKGPEAAGLPRDVRFHDLRHTAATLMLKKRMPVNVVTRVLGHSDPAMTLRRYALPHMLAAEAMERYAF